jgi:membrane protein YqaA with SNARE-associated domain
MTEFVVFCFVSIIVVVFTGATVALFVLLFVNPNGDYSTLTNAMTDVMNTLIGALIGFIAGKGQGKADAQEEQEKRRDQEKKVQEQSLKVGVDGP